MPSGVLTWCICVLREKNACAPFLYNRNVLTTATILMTLPLCGLLSVFIWHLDIRARRIWVHGIIHSRQTYSEYDHLGQEQEKEQRWRHQHLSEKLIFQLEVLGAVALGKKRCWALHLFLGCLPAAADACSSLETKDRRPWTSEKNAIPTKALRLFTHTDWYESAISLLIWFFAIKGISPFPKVLGCCFKWDNSCTKWKICLKLCL